MRGQWDHEQALSPSLLRSAMALLSGLLAVWTLATTAFSVLAVVEGRYEPAVIQFIGGLAVPFAIWLAARILFDLLIVHHRSLDRLTALAEASGHRTRSPPPSQDTRAGDDGPVYPEEAA